MSSIHGGRIVLRDIYTFDNENNEVVCTVCKQVGYKGNFGTNGNLTIWNAICHTSAIHMLRNQCQGTLKTLLTRTHIDRENKLEMSKRKGTNSDEIESLIDNVILPVKLNTSMLSLQEIYDHVSKYISTSDHK